MTQKDSQELMYVLSAANVFMAVWLTTAGGAGWIIAINVAAAVYGYGVARSL